jgi:hypothetical protein
MYRPLLRRPVDGPRPLYQAYPSLVAEANSLVRVSSSVPVKEDKLVTEDDKRQTFVQ